MNESKLVGAIQHSCDDEEKRKKKSQERPFYLRQEEMFW